jgi:hypothetical protein
MLRVDGVAGDVGQALTRGTAYDLYAVAALTAAGSTAGPDGSAVVYDIVPPRVGTSKYCPPRHPTHFQPSFI